MPPADDELIHFLHLQRTGGKTFEEQLRRTFGVGRMVPHPRDVAGGGLLYADPLGGELLEPGQLEDKAVVHGHHAYATRLRTARTVRRLTILREPVARTVSHLQALRAAPGLHPDRETAAELFADDEPFHRACYADYQTRWLGSTREQLAPIRVAVWRLLRDPSRMAVRAATWGAAERWRELVDDPEVLAGGEPVPTSGDVGPPVDRAMLERAKENLGRCDVFGITEDFDGFLADVRHRFGWALEPIDPLNSFAGWAVDDDTVRAIGEQNAFDGELHEWARTEAARRRRADRRTYR